VGPLTLSEGQVVDVDVDFSPLSVGTHDAVLTIASNAQGSPHHVSLHGKCRPGTPH
jgi:hypothetical protein